MAPTVVLLHAFPFDRHVWDGVVDALADADWDVVVPDLRGFGESSYGEDGPDDEPSLSWTWASQSPASNARRVRSGRLSPSPAHLAPVAMTTTSAP